MHPVPFEAQQNDPGSILSQFDALSSVSPRGHRRRREPSPEGRPRPPEGGNPPEQGVYPLFHKISLTLTPERMSEARRIAEAARLGAAAGLADVSRAAQERAEQQQVQRARRR